MEQAMSVLTQLPITKSSISSFMNQLVDEAVSGDGREPLELDGIATIMGYMFKELKANEELKQACLEQASKYPEKTFKYRIGNDTIEITKKSTNSYDFSVCNDEVYNSLLEQLKKDMEVVEKTKALIKNREDALKNGQTYDGEILTKPIHRVTETLSYKLSTI